MIILKERLTVIKVTYRNINSFIYDVDKCVIVYKLVKVLILFVFV